MALSNELNAIYGYDSYYQSTMGIFIPKTSGLKSTNSKATQVNELGWNTSNTTLEQHVRWQIGQSRRKYFIFNEMYKRDTWIRATIDYIVRRVTRDDNRFVDLLDPNNPDVPNIKEWVEYAYADGTFRDIYRGIAYDVLKYNQAYVYIERNRRGEPLRWWPMDARIVFPLTDLHGSIIAHAQVYNGDVQVFMPEEVLYFPLWNNGSNPNGVASMETLYESVRMELEANRFNAALFENNLNIGAVFSMTEADPNQLEENRRYLIENYAGAENAYNPLLLSGDTKMLRDGAMAIKDINFELLVRIARHRVSAVFGVPESLLGIPDNTNRATANTHEHNTYVNTIRPLRKDINARFTYQFIRRTLGNKTVTLEEPLNSMLPTMEEIEAVNKIAENGILFNDYLEMTGRPRVPFGDYWILKTPNGFVRLDDIMPGLGFARFDPYAYQREQEAALTSSQDMAKAGLMGVETSNVGTAKVAPEYQIQNDPIAARIVDLSRNMDEAEAEDWTIERRIPMAPGSRGSTTLYTTKTGKARYGAPPKKQAPVDAPGGGANENTLLNPKDINMPARLTPEEQLMVHAARNQVEQYFRQAQIENWNNDQFFSKMEELGWQRSQDTRNSFQDARDARAEASRLSETYPQNVYTILGADGEYIIMENEMNAFKNGPTDISDESSYKNTNGILEGKPAPTSASAGTGNPSALKREKSDTGNPSRSTRGKTDSGSPTVSRGGSSWAQRLREFVGEKNELKR